MTGQAEIWGRTSIARLFTDADGVLVTDSERERAQQRSEFE